MRAEGTASTGTAPTGKVSSRASFADIDRLLASVPRFASSSGDGRGELISPVNFAQKLKGKDALVFVKKDWCPYCQRYEPEFAKLADSWREKYGEGYKLYKVEISGDSEPEKKIARDYSIQGVPTLLMFRKDGEWKAFQGPRKPEDIEAQFTEFVRA